MSCAIPRRGASGALYRQSASAGLICFSEAGKAANLIKDRALKAGSGALLVLESRQVRKEAAVRDT